MMRSGDQGFSVVRGGQEIGRIPQPTAIDAQGAPVEVDTALTDRGLELSVPHREADVAYPILVDPVYEQWLFDSTGWPFASWYFGNNLQGLWTWGWDTNTGAAPYNILGQWNCAFPSNPSFHCWAQSGYSLYEYTRSNTGYGPGRYGQFVYTVPGGTGTAAFIHRVQFGQVMTDRHNCTSQAEPHPYFGIWNTNSAGWEGYGSAWWNGDYPEYISNDNTGDDMVVMGMGTGGASGNIPCWRDFMAGGAVITLNDFANPTIDSVSAPNAPPGWTKGDTGPFSINVSAHDNGLGLKMVRAWSVGPAGVVSSDGVHPCTGNRVWSECPQSWNLPDSATNAALSINPAQISDGDTGVYLFAQDVAGNTSTPQPHIPLLIDRGNPSIDLGGDLVDPTIPGQTLSVRATDPPAAGDVPTSGVTKIEVTINGSLYQTETQACPPGPNNRYSCEMDRFFPITVPSGATLPLHIGVTAYDQAGNHTTSSVDWRPETYVQFDPPLTAPQFESSIGSNWNQILNMEYGGDSSGFFAPQNEVSAHSLVQHFTSGVASVGALSVSDSGQISTGAPPSGGPTVTAATFTGTVAQNDFGTLADHVTSADRVDDLGLTGQAPQPEDGAEDPQEYTDANDDTYADPDDVLQRPVQSSRKWAPYKGVTVVSTPGGIPTIANTMRWYSQDQLYAFPTNAAYEHNWREINPSLPHGTFDKKPHCGDAGDNFWIDRHDKSIYDLTVGTTYPDKAKPYMDTPISDPCTVEDFTVGVMYPRRLQAHVKYTTIVQSSRGDNDHSQFGLYSQWNERVCDDGAWCVDPDPTGGILSRSAIQWLVSSSKGVAPGCRQWVKGTKSNPCS